MVSSNNFDDNIISQDDIVAVFETTKSIQFTQMKVLCCIYYSEIWKHQQLIIVWLRNLMTVNCKVGWVNVTSLHNKSNESTECQKDKDLSTMLIGSPTA